VAGQRGGFLRDAFHQIAVAANGVDSVVDDLVAGAIEVSGQPRLSHGHADGVCDALALFLPKNFLGAQASSFYTSPGLLFVPEGRRILLFTSAKTAADWAPSVTVSRNQFVGFRRPLAAGRVVREFRRLLIRPSLQDGSDQSPLIFDLIPPDEERRVALHHVQQERLVSGRQTHAE